VPGFTSPWSRSPPESPRPPADRPSRAGADSHEVLRPFDGIPRASPVCSGSSTVRCGSAPRFSQPLGGFLARPGFAALSHAAAARGVLPSEPCSSPGSRAPLGVAVLPCSSPPGFNSQGSNAAFSLRVSPTPAPLDAVAWIPTGARTPFPPRARVRPPRLPRRPDRARPPGRVRSHRLRLLRSLDPPAKPYRDARRSGPPRPLLSWASPLQSLAPIEPRTLMTRRTVPSTAR
jgi:hypothetical protein